MKAHIRKYFPSIDHAILHDLIARKIKDPDVLWVVRLIVEHSNPQDPVLDWFPRRRSVYSQPAAPGDSGRQPDQPVFANVYLDPLDHFVKERLRIQGYVRYVDDFLLFSDDKALLAAARDDIANFLIGLRLRLHPRKNVIFPVSQGIRFLGYRVFPTHRLLAKENVWR